MTPRAARVLAWSLWGLAAVVAASSVVPLAKIGFRYPEAVFGFPGWPAILGLALASVGALIFSQRPSNRIGWLFIAVGCASAVQELVTAYAAMAVDRGEGVPGGAYSAWVVDWIWIPLTGGLLVYLFLLFPEGRVPPGRAGRMAAVLGGVGIVLAVLGAALRPGPLETFATVDNPFPLNVTSGVAEVLAFGFQLFIVAGVIAIVGMARRWRRAAGVERQQYRWLIASGAVLAVTLVAFSVIVAFELLDPDQSWLAMQLPSLVGFTAVPVGVGIAILRYRLYDLDRLISRTVTYAVVVGLLVAVYVGGILLFGSLLPLQGDVAVAASTLAAAALFNALRRRVQARVDRRFNRPRYDAEQEVERFTSQLRNELDLDELTDDLLAVVATTMQPATATVWIRKDPA